MPRTKKSTKKTSAERVSSTALSKAYESEISFETKTVITIILLLFVYPVGLILMWWWMREWPLWLKLLLSIPLFFAVLALFGMIFIIGALIHSVPSQRAREIQIQERMMQRNLWVTPTDAQNAPISY